MAINKTENLEITYLSSNQTNKEILINEGFLKFDSLMNNGAKSASTTTPPASPYDSDLYIIPASATGEWSGEDGKFTFYNSSKGWVILTPNEGMTLWVNDENELYTYDGANWVSSGEVESLDKLGINATADSTNKLSVKSDAVLFDNDGNDSQVKVNKDSTSDNASHLFQTNYSGRAEFGLTGDDDFHIKVSDDGSTWNEAAIIDKSSGRIDIEEGISFDSGTNKLDFYEEGTLTPTVYGSVTAGTPTGTFEGKYTRIGNVCYINIYISLTALGSMAGTMRISGLPFDVANSDDSRGSVSVSYDNVTLNSSGSSVSGRFIINSDEIQFYEQAESGSTNLSTTNDITNSSELYISGTYFVS